MPTCGKGNSCCYSRDVRHNDIIYFLKELLVYIVTVVVFHENVEAALDSSSKLPCIVYSIQNENPNEVKFCSYFIVLV